MAGRAGIRNEKRETGIMMIIAQFLPSIISILIGVAHLYRGYKIAKSKKIEYYGFTPTIKLEPGTVTKTYVLIIIFSLGVFCTVIPIIYFFKKTHN